HMANCVYCFPKAHLKYCRIIIDNSLLLPSPGETSLMPHTAWTHTPLSLPFLPPQTKHFMRGTLELFDNTGWYNSGCLELCLSAWNVHMRLGGCLWCVLVCG